MQIHQDCCPNCMRKFCFPVKYAAEHFLAICPHCRVGYNLVKVEVNEEILGNLLLSRSVTPFWQKSKISKHIFQYLRSIATDFRFVTPTQANAIIFQVARTRSPYPLAVYFHDTYYRIRAFNSLLLSTLLVAPVVVFLLSIGFLPISVLLGTAIAIVFSRRFISLPRIKGTTHNQLVAEQLLLQQGYGLHQSLNRIKDVKVTYQNLLTRQRSVLEQMMQAPTHYSTGIDIYQRAIKCTDDYLNLCDLAIGQYQFAISSIEIQIETSKLAVEIPDRFVVPQLEFGLDRLEEQLAKTIPPELPRYDPNNYNKPTN